MASTGNSGWVSLTAAFFETRLAATGFFSVTAAGLEAFVALALGFAAGFLAVFLVSPGSASNG